MLQNLSSYIPSIIQYSLKQNINTLDYTTSANVISVSDINNMISGINSGIIFISALCTDQFKNFWQNPHQYITVHIDNKYYVVNAYNNKVSNAYGFSGVILNDIQYSITKNTLYNKNLDLGYFKDGNQTILSTYNESYYDVVGFVGVKLNGIEYIANTKNAGNINVGNIFNAESYVTSFNGAVGNVYGVQSIYLNGKWNTNCGIDLTLNNYDMNAFIWNNYHCKWTVFYKPLIENPRINSDDQITLSNVLNKVSQTTKFMLNKKFIDDFFRNSIKFNYNIQTLPCIGNEFIEVVFYYNSQVVKITQLDKYVNGIQLKNKLIVNKNEYYHKVDNIHNITFIMYGSSGNNTKQNIIKQYWKYFVSTESGYQFSIILNENIPISSLVDGSITYFQKVTT